MKFIFVVVVTALFYVAFFLLLKKKYSTIKEDEKQYATKYGKLLANETSRGFFEI